MTAAPGKTEAAHANWGSLECPSYPWQVKRRLSTAGDDDSVPMKRW